MGELGGRRGTPPSGPQIAFSPARILMQDFTGVPVVADLAAMRDAMVALGGDPVAVQPQVPAELVIDHSVIADFSGRPDAFRRNSELEFERNEERYRFLRWGQQAFGTLKVVPPNTGICHQVNLEHLARVVFRTEDGEAYPDTLLGTDSHTTMVNGLGVLGWGVGGIEAEAAMLGEPVTMLIPDVVGFKLTGELPEGSTATDLVLTVTELLRKHGVVGKFVEFYGDGVAKVALYNRATIGNMSPEYGSTCAIFPIDEETLRYLRFTGRSEDHVKLVEAYAKDQGLWHDPSSRAGVLRAHRARPFHRRTEPGRAGPAPGPGAAAPGQGGLRRVPGQGPGRGQTPRPTGCRWRCPVGPSGPSVRGRRRLRPRPRRRGHRRHNELHQHLQPRSHDRRRPCGKTCRGARAFGQALGEDVPGPGVQGRHGLLRTRRLDALSRQARVRPGRLRLHHLHRQQRAAAGRCLRGGRRGRPGRGRRSCRATATSRAGYNPDVRMNYLASPPLVVAYALAGSMDFDITGEPLGTGTDGPPVYLRDIWPSTEEVAAVIDEAMAADMFEKSYAEVFVGDERWAALEVPPGELYEWGTASTYVRQPPYLRRHARGAGPRP